ncbi:MAG TPA: DUF4097 family beta strand repeat-containing protein [Longimicrobiales bacterium]|nr:DUF4097 family beta strand repeat-containing protein [Longimicrobiales bacterium]
MKGIRGTLAAGALLALAVAVDGVGAQEPFEWSGSIARGGTLEVKGISGSIRAELASGNAAEVTAVKKGDQDDFEQVEVRVVKDGADVTICAVYGDPDGGDGCEGGNARRGLFRRNRPIDVSVDFVVRLPAGTSLNAGLVSGDVSVSGVRSDVSASTVSGDVTISTTGLARAHAVSGDLDVSMGAADWDELDFNTVSGDITLRLPAAADADLEFNSVSGDLTSDFEMTLTGRLGRRWPGQAIRATIGDGGRPITLKTVSGDVRLLRAG